MKYSNPVIIMGMHRSGTTMVTEMLNKLGLFVGRDLEKNCESWFFISMNEWLLKQSGAGWHNPEAVTYLLNNEKVESLAAEYAKCRLNGLSIAKYVGWKKFLNKEIPSRGMNSPWGWKDPRNTYTLGFWLKLFPNARIINIYRNGVPVAASLRERDVKGLDRFTKKHLTRKKLGLYNLFAKKGGFVNSVRCLELRGGFSLWEEYVIKGMEQVMACQGNVIDIKYEEFVDEPEKHMRVLADFCGLNFSEQQLQDVCADVQAEKASSYCNNDELVDFYKTVKSNKTMIKLGYSEPKSI